MASPELNFNPKKQSAMLDELETYFSYVLDAASLNVADPISSNICFFNNIGKVFADTPKLGRTYIFVTRPNMNFASAHNINTCRAFSNIVESKLNCTLARYLMYGPAANYISYGSVPSVLSWSKLGVLVNGPAKDKIVGGIDVETGLKSYGVDFTNFIPLLSNCCTETSGGKDIVLETEETEGDYSGNRMVYASGIDDTMGPGEITLTFDDLYGSPVLNLAILWVYYMHYVAKGICVPTKANIVNRIIDYTCSIYIFMTDTDQKTIVRWTKYCGCFPKSLPYGQIMHTKEINLQALSQVQIPFQYSFACPNDPMVLSEFNMLAEAALWNRAPITSNDGGDFTKTQDSSFTDFLRGKNHVYSEWDMLEFKAKFPPVLNPMKLLNPKVKDIGRADNIATATPVPMYENVDGGVDIDKLMRERDLYPSQYNKYNGLIDPYNNRQPLIVDGNKLIFV